MPTRLSSPVVMELILFN